MASSKKKTATRKRKSARTVTAANELRPTSVFVIMPFTKTLTRNAAQLLAFYTDHLKQPIEGESFLRPHVVRRSDESFNITEQIIKDLYAADVVICDLSGPHANPNVMYELGIRLAVSNKPVILIREAHADNHPIFDIGGFYAEQYDPLYYSKITAHVITKLHRFETAEEVYASPVLKLLSLEEPLIQTLSKQRASYLLHVLASSVTGTTRLFSGAVVKNVEAIGDLSECKTPDDLLQLLMKNADRFDSIDWSGLRFRIGTQPAIDAYLASLYLVGMVETEIENRFTKAVLDYHAYFLSGDLWFDSPRLYQVIVYLGESLVLAQLARILAVLLLENDAAEQAKLREVFDAVYGERRL